MEGGERQWKRVRGERISRSLKGAKIPSSFGDRIEREAIKKLDGEVNGDGKCIRSQRAEGPNARSRTEDNSSGPVMEGVVGASNMS